MRKNATSRALDPNQLILLHYLILNVEKSYHNYRIPPRSSAGVSRGFHAPGVCQLASTLSSSLPSVVLPCFYLREFALPIFSHYVFVEHFPIFHPPTHSRCYCGGHSNHSGA